MTTQVHCRCAAKSSRFSFFSLSLGTGDAKLYAHTIHTGCLFFSFLSEPRTLRPGEPAIAEVRAQATALSAAPRTRTQAYSCRRTRINRPRDGEPRSLAVAATAVAAATTAVQHYTEPTAKNDHVSSSPRSPAITTGITEITRRKAENSWLPNNNGVVDVCWGTREQTTSFSNSGKHEGEEEAAQWGKKRWRFGTQMAPNGAAARAPGHDVARDVFY